MESDSDPYFGTSLFILMSFTKKILCVTIQQYTPISGEPENSNTYIHIHTAHK